MQRSRISTTPILTTGFLVLGTLIATPTVASAQGVVDDALVEKAKNPGELSEGWNRSLSLGLTGSFNHSSNVVGSADGSTVQLGLVTDGAATLVRGSHVWENQLKLQHTQSRTPAIDRFLKSLDNLDIQSTYLYHLATPNDWFGPFARVGLVTSVLEGYEVRAADTNITRVFRDGHTEDSVVAAEEDISLTDPFEPMTFKETVGIFADPIRRDDLKVTTKTGIGLQQIMVGDGFALTSDVDGQVTLTQLQEANELGAEFEIGLNGSRSEDITYEATLSLFYPMTSSADVDFDGIDALNTDFSGKISFKLTGWASLDYVLNVKRSPVILDEWQVTNGLILTSSFSLL
jgi:hypothetical protein